MLAYKMKNKSVPEKLPSHCWELSMSKVKPSKDDW